MCPDQTFRCCGDGAGPGWLPAVPAGAERGCHTRFLGRRHPTGRGAVPARRLAGCGPTGGRPGGPGRGAAVRGSPEALPGGPSPLPCEATATAGAAAPPLLAALPGTVTLAATRFSWLSHKTETGCAAPSRFCTGRDLCRPWGPQLSAVARGPLAAPRGVFPRTRRGRRCRPGRPGPRKARPPAARGPQARCTGAERISHARPMPLAGGMRGVFLPGDLSGPPLCPSRRLTEKTGQSSRAESVASVPGRGGCVIPRSLGPRPPRAPSRARLPRPQSHPQAPPALARPGLTWSPRAALGHVPRGLSKSAW